MNAQGSSIAQSLAGAAQAERLMLREKDRQNIPQLRANRVRDPKNTGEGVDKVEIDSAVRGLASNDQEEAREDRRENPAYTAPNQHQPPPPARSIDIQG
jgi:hypothetical protein